MKKLFLIFHTLKYLKPKQVYYRLSYIFLRPKISKTKSLHLRFPSLKTKFKSYQEPATLDGCSYTFLGLTYDPSENRGLLKPSKLWLYNYHYHADLVSIGSETRLEQNKNIIENWISENSSFSGIGWDSYCISIRVVNWIKWFLQNQDRVKIENYFLSIRSQIEMLEQKIEYDILANHLFSNAKALVFAGTYFNGIDADRWLSKGLSILDQEISEQFLHDGGHFELSPMYHSLLLWDLADLINLSQSSGLPALSDREKRWGEYFTRGLSWLEGMIHPDGDISFFNDSTLEIAPTFDDIETYADYLNLNKSKLKEEDKLSAKLFSDTGYVTIDWAPDTKLIADIGRVGPNYQPGHAHADTLSCELSIFGHRVLVNSGISEYGKSDERKRQRSTSAHNTVEVNKKDSSEVWAGFRVARRAFPYNVVLDQNYNSVNLQAEHSGYHRLSHKVSHKRVWSALKDQLTIEDILKGKYKSAVGFWHLHPDVKAEIFEPSSVRITLPNEDKVYLKITGANIAVRQSTWHSGFGLSIDNKCIAFTFLQSNVVTSIFWGKN